MKLSDIMSAAGLSAYAEIAMILFIVAFVAIVINTFAPSRQKTYDAASRMPLDDEHPQTPR
ncbi:MAG: cbb3-type cytochrome oxidase subunit 3 [Gemmatimonadaceae bacterium]